MRIIEGVREINGKISIPKLAEGETVSIQANPDNTYTIIINNKKEIIGDKNSTTNGRR